jgi:tetratricopeptide (TPR) repeat protein
MVNRVVPLALVSVIAAHAVFASASPPKPEAQAAFNEATRLWQSRQPEAAIKQLDRAIELDPRYVEAYLKRGFAYKELKQRDRALADYGAAVRLAPTNPNVYNERGGALLAFDQLDAALADFETVARLAPWAIGAHFNRGLVYKKKNELTHALAAFDKALAMNPNYPAAYMERGLVFLRSGKNRDAQLEFERGQWFKPGIQSDYALQIEAARKAATPEPAALVKPPGGSTSLQEAVRLIVVKQDREALRHLDAAIAQNARDADAYLYRGKAHYNLRQIGRASEDVKEALRQRPNDPEAHRMLGRLHEQVRQGDQAIEAYTRAIQIDPGFAMAYVDRGAAYRRHRPNLAGTAAKDFDAAVRVDPGNPYAWYNRAFSWGVDINNPRVDWNFEIANLNKAIEVKPDFAMAYARRGIAYVGKSYEVNTPGLLEQGRKDVERALTLDPSLAPYIQSEIDSLKHLPAIYAYGRKMIAELMSGLTRPPERGSSSGPDDPCAGYRGGTANACRARDWMATDRYKGGAATGEDKKKYGSY